jgi:hypothetical protein
MEPVGSLPCSQEPSTGPYLEPNQSSPYHPILSFLRSVLILSTLLRRGLTSGFFPLAFPTRSYIYSSSPHSCYMLCPSHTPSLGHSDYTCRRVQVTKLLIMQFSQTSCHPIPLGSNIFLSILVSNTLNLYFSLNVRDQVSHPYRTTGKIIVLYILICTFLDSRRANKIFWTEW